MLNKCILNTIKVIAQSEPVSLFWLLFVNSPWYQCGQISGISTTWRIGHVGSADGYPLLLMLWTQGQRNALHHVTELVNMHFILLKLLQCESASMTVVEAERLRKSEGRQGDGVTASTSLGNARSVTAFVNFNAFRRSNDVITSIVPIFRLASMTAAQVRLLYNYLIMQWI